MKLFIITLAVSLLCTAAARESATAQSEQKNNPIDFSSFEAKDYQKNSLTLPYRILWPENMQKGTKYPLFLFLHGMGKRGTDNKAQLNLGGELFLQPENRRQYPCIVLYPQAPKTSAFVEILGGDKIVVGTGLGEFAKARAGKGGFALRLSPYGNMVMDVVNQLIACGVADTDRIYIAGTSMGGFSTYAFIAQYPDLFAAAAPIAAAADVSKISAWAGKVPVWIFHGDDDAKVPVRSPRTVVSKLKEMGITNFKYSEYPNCGHGSWIKAFTEPDYISWFFSHSKAAGKK